MDNETILRIEENSYTIDELLKNFYEYLKFSMIVINRNYEIEGLCGIQSVDEAISDENISEISLPELIRLTNTLGVGETRKVIDLPPKGRFLFYRLCFQNNFLGWLIIKERDEQSFEQTDRELSEHLSKSIIKILRLKTGDVGFSQLNFWKSLVNHTYASREIFEAKAAEYKIPLTYNYRVLLLSLDKYDNTEEGHIRNGLKNILHNFYLMVKENHVIVIIDKELRPEAITLLNKFFAANGINAILSSKIIDLYELDVIISNLIKLFIYLIKLSDDFCLKFEEDNKLLVPLFNAPDNDVILNYINETILDIYLYDKEKDSCLLDTVYQYLLNNKSLDKTAKILFVHKNTVMYRLQKVKDLFNINFDNPNNNLSYMYSTAILKYLISVECKGLDELKADILMS